MNASADTPTHMRHSIPRLAFGLAAGVTLLVFLWLANNVFTEHADQELATDQELLGIELQQRILYLDEVLTMSARMAASTGDEHWEANYKQHEPQLDAALRDALVVFPEAHQSEAAKRTDDANAKLIVMEHHAFALINKGDLAGAREILFSSEYDEHKWIYGESMQRFAGVRTRSSRLMELEGSINHLDELLSMSASMAVTTGEPKWEQRYGRFEPKLIAAIDEATDLVPGLRQQDASRTASHANQLLLALNQRAFELVREGELQAAKDMLISEQYKSARKSYEQGMQGLSSLLKQERQSVRATRKASSLQQLGLLGLLLAVVSTCWVLLWKAFSSRSAGLDTQAHLHLVALEAAANAIFVTDTEGRIEWVNPAYCKLTGYSPAESIGQIPRLFDSTRRTPHARKSMWATINKGSSYTGEVTDQRKNGSEFPSSLIVAPVRRLNGPIAHLVVVMEDTTDRRAFEKGLVEGMESAEVASRTKSEFLTEVSHQIRTPLTGILGLTQVIMEGELAPELVDHARTLEACGQSLLDQVNDVLDISQLDMGGMTFKKEPFDLHMLVQDACGASAAGAADCNRRVQVDFPENLPGYALVDGPRFEQVLINLLDNTIRITEGGDIQVKVRWQRDDGYDREVLRVEVNVEDRDLDTSLFESSSSPFRLSAPNQQLGYAETGIRLLVTKQLLKSMLGSMGADSTDSGTSFYFELPLEPCDKPEATVAGDRLSNLRVLVAEDDHVTRLVVHRMLLKLGCTVEVVPGGEQAVERALSGNFDMVLMDCLMPEVNGYEATRRIRQAEAADPSLGHMPILAVSSLALEGDHERIINSGMDDHLVKPLGTEAMRAGMLLWLKDAGQESDNSERKAG
ncbi:MAG: PAS domain S-box-containing protein [Planctomycetota bacterium]|jgi:PAS domain S-box-containing protein